jgi:CBS domain-containing protein
MNNLLVSDIMTRDPITIKPESDLLECAKKMVRKRVGSLLLVTKKKLVGIISERDILWALVKTSKKKLKEIKAIDISPKKIATIRPKAKIREAFEKMSNLKFERLPVIIEGELVGVITAKDILNFHPEFYPELNEYSEIREKAKKLQRIEQAQKRVEGICEECGRMELLYKENGMLLCENCKEQDF